MIQKLSLFSLIVAAAFAVSGSAQTVVSATVTSSENAPFANGTWRATLVDANTNPLYLSPGSSTYSGPRVVSGSLDSTGTFSVTLTPNASIASGSQWNFTICSSAAATFLKGTSTCFTSAQTISGSTQSLSTALSSVSPSLAISTPPIMLPADPTAALGAATKEYVDAHGGGTATLPSGSTGQFPYYAANGTTVVAHTLVAADIPGTVGNAATATALAATPSGCTGSQFATGIAANGNATCATPSGGGSLPTQTVPSYLVSNGSSASFGDIVVDASGLCSGTGCSGGSAGVLGLNTAVIPNKTSGTQTITNAWDFTGASQTKAIRTVSSLPGTCSQYEEAYLTTATAGQNLYACTATNTWTLEGGSGGGGVSLTTAGVSGDWIGGHSSGTPTNGYSTGSSLTPIFAIFSSPYASRTITHVAVSISTSATGSCILGYYNASTGAQVGVASNSFSVASTGAVLVTFPTSVTLPGGTYYKAWNCNITAGTLTFTSDDAGAGIDFAMEKISGLLTSAPSGYGTTQGSLVLPSTTGTITAGSTTWSLAEYGAP